MQRSESADDNGRAEANDDADANVTPLAACPVGVWRQQCLGLRLILVIEGRETMIQIGATFNGKPISEASIADDLKKEMLDLLVTDVREESAAAVTPEEVRQIAADIVDDDTGHLFLKIEVPETIANKIRSALASETA